MASIWSAAAATPTAAHRLPADVSAAGIPTYYSVQQIADLYISTGVTANAIGNVTGATAISLAAGGVVTATVTGNTTFSITNPPTAASEWVLILTNGGAHTITWFTTTWAGGTAPTLTASGVDVIHFATPNGGTTWYGWHETDFAVGTTAGTVAAGDDSRMTDDRTASGLRSATTVVSVSAATAPSSGQVLTATSGAAATWQTPAAGSPAGSSGQPQYNNAGAFGGMTGVAWDNALQKVTYTGAGVSGLAVIRIVGGSGTSSTRINDNGTVIIDADVGTGTTPLTVKYNGSNVATISYQGQFTGVNYGTSGATGQYTFSSGTALVGLSASAGFYLRYGTTAQKVLVSGTYTDASNYVRASLAATSTAVTLAAETAGTGADNVPVILTPAGTSQVEVGNGVQFTEMTAPSAPAANKVILFAQDNGAGKTQLMALFPSGASQQVAIEP